MWESPAAGTAFGFPFIAKSKLPVAEHKSRNAFLRGWFAARSRRRPPSSDDFDETLFANNGYEAGKQSGGYALAPLVNTHEANAVRASLDRDMTATISPAPKPRPTKAQPEVKSPEPEAMLTPEAQAQLHGFAPSAIGNTDEDEDVPRQNHFLPQRKAGSSRMRAGPRRYKQG
ncbi:MAG: hypothetical protein ABI619_08120 [Betaproteobacteria bacterium]